MLRFVVRRLALLLFVLLGLTLLIFFLVFLLPGDPAAGITTLSSSGTSNPEAIEAFRSFWGLDKPLHVQYATYMRNVVRGDLGISMVSNRFIFDELKTFFPATLELAICAGLMALLIGIPAGIIAAVRRNSLTDHAVRIVSLFGTAMPIFWVAILALYVFFFFLGWFPSSQRIALTLDAPPFVTGLYLIDTLIATDFAGFRSAVHHLLLPSAILAFSAVALLARIMRSSMLEVLSEEYIRTARAKGLPERIVLLHHALRNAIIPTLNAIGLLFGALLSGAVLTETIFSWPGIGRFAVQSILYLDRPAIMGVTLLIGVVYSVINLSVDLIMFRLDPRIRLDETR